MRPSGSFYRETQRRLLCALAFGCIAALASAEARADDELITRIYKIPHTFIRFDIAGENTQPDPFADTRPDQQKAPKGLLNPRQILEKVGIEFGTGADATAIVHRLGYYTLVVRNTAEQLDLFEAYGGFFGSQPKQILVSVEHIEVDADWWNGWLHERRRETSDNELRSIVQKMVRSGDANVQDTSVILARSGQRAKTESQRTLMVPGSADPPEVANKVNLEGEAEAPETPNCPTSFNDFHEGISLEVDPVIGADGVTIDLNLSPRRTYLKGFVPWPSPQGKPETRQDKPNFYVENLATQLTVTDGNYALIGTVDPPDTERENADDEGKRRKVLVFVRADVQTVPMVYNRRLSR